MLQICSINLSKPPLSAPQNFAGFGGFDNCPETVRLKSSKRYHKVQSLFTNVKSTSGNSVREEFFVSCFKMSESPIQSFNASFGFNNCLSSVRLKAPKWYHKVQFFGTNVKSMLGNSNREKFLVSCFKNSESPIQSFNVMEKVHCLACEFKSLPEPIDRVKRLLHYATLLPPFNESGRVQENRVTGCTTMVWLEVEMDNNRLMRFRVDSDSEITKGFSSCLIWLFDGAAPEEVLSVKNDDLLEMNVGFPSRGPSRVNTWNNILITMQKRTKILVEERDRERPSKDFSPFVIRPIDGEVLSW